VADQNLNLQVAATATGDGLRKTTAELRELNAETARAAPLAAEAKTREEQIAAVRERHTAAAREQAAAEALLDEKRAASPFFNGSAPAAPAGGDAGEGSLLEAGMAGGLAGAAATAATMLAKSAVDMLVSIPQKMEESRLETERLTAELMKMAQQWLEMAKNAKTAGDVLQLQKQQREELSKLTEEIEKNKRSGSIWDVLMAKDDNANSWWGVFFDNSTKRIKKLEEERKVKLAAAEATERTANKEKEAYQQIENLPPPQRLAALGEAMMDLQEKQGSTPKFSEQWNAFAVEMEQLEKRTKAATAEIEKLTEARAKDGAALEANMAKEAERFAQAEKALALEKEREERERERLRMAGERMNDEQDRERQKNAKEDARAAEKEEAEKKREKEKAQREIQQQQDRDARDRARIEDEESRWRTKHNIPPPGFLNGSDAPKRSGGSGRGPGGGLTSGGLTSGGLTSGGTGTDFRAVFGDLPSAAAESQAAAQSLAEAAGQIVTMMAAKTRADAEVARKMREAATQANIHS